MPHSAFEARQGDRRCAVPIQLAEKERAAGRCGHHFNAHRGDGIAAHVRRRPRQRFAVSRFDGHGGIAQRHQFVVGIENADADGRFHRFVGVLGQFQHRFDGLPWR